MKNPFEEHDHGSASPVGSGVEIEFRQALELLPIGAYICDADGLITYFNARAVEIWGREPSLRDPVDRFCGSWRLHFPNGASMPHDQCWMAVALDSQQTVAGEEVVVERPDGTRRTALAYAGPIFGEQGELRGAINMLVDITERKRAQEQFSVAVEASPSATVIVDADGRIVLVNRQTETLFGYGREELVGQSVDMLVPARFRDRHPGYRGGFLSEPRPRPMGAGRDLFGVRKDGTEVPIEIGLNPIDTTDGVMVLSTIVDITERKEAERALRESEERLRELNQSLEEKVQQRTEKLVAYQEQLRLLAAKLGASEQQERRRVAVELHDNLAQLLAISKMKLGLAQRQLPEMEDNDDVASVMHALDDALKYTRTLISDLSPPFDLGQTELAEAVRWVAEKMQQRGLQVEIDDDDHPKPMSAECMTTTFESVRELLFNVVRHGGTNTAKVVLRRRGDRVVVTVADEGIGFDPEEKPLVPNETGGLGLFSARERLAALQGRLMLHSAPGAGTRAIIDVPVGDNEASDEKSHDRVREWAARGRAIERGGSGKIRVLLVDDHEMMREGLRRTINAEADMEVVAEAADGEMAVQLAREVRPDLVVMDVGLPGINGIEATRRIMASNPALRVVALSFNETAETIDAMVRAGACDYVFKSQAYGRLCAAIREHAPARHRSPGTQ